MRTAVFFHIFTSDNALVIQFWKQEHLATHWQEMSLTYYFPTERLRGYSDEPGVRRLSVHPSVPIRHLSVCPSVCL